MSRHVPNFTLTNLPQRGGGLVRILAGLGVLGLVGVNSLYNVEGGHRAIIFNKITGTRPEVIPEGTHLRIPFLDVPVIYDVRSKPRNISSPTSSKDLQMVNITLRVLSRPDIKSLPWIHQRLGTDYDERVLPSIVNEVLKSVVAQFTAAQLVTEREKVSMLIRKRLKERAHEFRLQLDDVSITHLTFGREYTAAVEAKQVAAQEAERAKFIVEKAQQDKRSVIIRAEGEAESARMISEAIKNSPNFLKLRKIEAAREIAHSVAKGGNRVFLPSDNLLFNLLTEEEDNTKRK